MSSELVTAIIGVISASLIAVITAYITTKIKIESERKKDSEDWRSNILEKYYSSFDDFQKLAQQFAIGIIFYEDNSPEFHHQKIFIPKNFNLTIGRSEFNDIRSSDRTVSRMHALLSSDSSDVFIEDLFATNKTEINGTMISGRTKLQNNDVIRIGNVSMYFKKISGWIG